MKRDRTTWTMAGRNVGLAEAWSAINRWIIPGNLPGNGTDKLAQRNGMILAANIVHQLLHDKPPKGQAMKNERTSKRVAKIAAKVLAIKVGIIDQAERVISRPAASRIKLMLGFGDCRWGPFDISLADLKALAGSGLTQAPDRVTAVKAKPKPKK